MNKPQADVPLHARLFHIHAIAALPAPDGCPKEKALPHSQRGK